MKLLIISEQTNSPQKLGLKILTNLNLYVRNLKASHALLDFIQNVLCEFSGLSKKGLQKIKIKRQKI